LYLTKATAWEEKGHEKVLLPALDLPISRTGLLLYYPPLFHVSAEPGTFHTEQYALPISAALSPPPPIVLIKPGISADSNGQLHGFGNHVASTGAGFGGGIGSGSSIAGPLAINGAPIGGPPNEFDRLENFAKIENAPKAAGPPLSDDEKKEATQALLDTFRAKSSAGKVTGILPVNVDFPAFGPSIYLVSELTSENQFPAAEFSFQREKEKKGGVR
jgi:hypothetical protein